MRWIDINKGDNTNPLYHSRLVAKECRTDVRPDLYAATPPSECLKLLLSRLASNRKRRLMYADVSRADFYAKAVRPVYVVLTSEDFEDGDENRCGELVMSMYGTRDAALNWSAEYTKTFADSGYIQGRASPCLFYNEQLDVAIMVHGDDFVAIGDDAGLADARNVLEDCYKLKVEMLGNGAGQVKEVRILNNIVRLTSSGIEMEADPRHSELVIRELGLEASKAMGTPGTKEGKRKTDDKEMHQSRLGDIGSMEQLLSRQTVHRKPAGCLESQSAVTNVVGGTNRWRGIEDGDRVSVESHGDGQVVGTGCCGHRGRVHIRYDDSTDFHCKLTHITHMNGTQIVHYGRNAKSSLVNVDSADDELDDDEDEPLGREEASRYRSVAARLDYLAPDRMDIQYAVQEAARSMSAPKRSDWKMLICIGRYLVGRPRLVMNYRWQNNNSTVVSYTDSDWAGCVRTARSTSGGIVTIGDHVVKTYSRQQKTVALSSAEAELYAMVAASAETLAIIAYARDLGLTFKGEVYTDSSAALGITQRAGIGKVRHLRTQGLWVQETLSTGRLPYMKVLGTKNPADVLTKHVPADLLNKHLETMNVTITEGRAEKAPELSALVVSDVEWLEELKGARGRHVNFEKLEPGRGV